MDSSLLHGEGFRLSSQQAATLEADEARGRRSVLTATCRFERELDIEGLCRVLDELCAEHEILRTVYRHVEGLRQPLQVVLPQPAVHVQQVPTAEAQAASEAANAPELAELALRRVDPAQGPVLSAAFRRSGLGVELALAVPACSLDRASMERLLALVEARLAGAPVPGPGLQYIDYSEWQHELRESAWGEQAATFWSTASSVGADGLLLPFEAGVPSQVVTREHEIDLGPASGALVELAERLGCSTADAAFCCWVAFLARLCARDDIVCRVAAGKSNPDVEATLGRFEQRVPVACSTPRGAPLRQVCATVLARRDECLAWREALPARGPGLPGDAPVSPPFGFEHRPRSEASGVCVRMAPEDAELERLRLEYIESEGTTVLRLSHRASASSPAWVGVWAEQLVTFIVSAARDVEQPLERVCTVGLKERRTLLERFAPGPWSARERRDARLLHQLFEERAVQRPDAVALIVGEATLSYRELNQRANQVAHALRGRGLEREEVVAVHAERSIEVVVAMLGILKAGGAYLPLDPSYPREHLRHMLKDARARVVLARGSLMEADAGATEAPSTALPLGDGIEVISLAQAAPVWFCPAHDPTPLSSPGELAYLIYTSGSTGKPKGVMVTHANVVASTLARSSFYDWRLDCFLLLSSVSFDSSVAGIFWTLSQGGALCVPEEGVQRDPRLVADLVRGRSVTHLLALPSFHAQLLDELGGGSGLRGVIVAGEACPAALVEKHFTQAPDVALVNEYGPTEGTVWCTAWQLSAGERGAIPIGVPIDSTRAYVLGPDREPVAIGAPGELYIGGAGITRGYFERPGLTAERFVPNPCGGPSGERLYRTGDAVRWRPDGVLEFLGRMDQQVKIRGYRIELGEIEVRLSEHDEVAEAAVVPREDTPGLKRLVAYLVPRRRAVVGDGAAEQQLRERIVARLKARLPEYMLPAQIVFLGSLPQTPNGKLDRAALPAPGALTLRAYVAPANELERRLAELWQESLRLERVGTRDNFFELGGDSILLLQLVARARNAGFEFTAQDVFRQPSIERLAALIAERDAAGDPQPVAVRPRATQAPANVPPEAPAAGFALSGSSQAELEALQLDWSDVEDIYPLSPMQEGMLLHTLLEPGSGIYLMQDQYSIQSAVDPEVLRGAWERVARRHEPLRASFRWQGDRKLLQVISRTPRVDMDYFDWRAIAPEKRERRLAEILREERERGFDLARAPLWKLRLIRVAEEAFELTISHHHIIVDGWSWGLIWAEVARFYRDAIEQTAGTEEVVAPYRDFIAWVRSRDLKAAERYWRETLAGFEQATPLPLDRPLAGLSGVSQIRALRVTLSEESSRQARQLCQRLGLTLNTLVQAAWALTLARHAGQEDVLFGVTVAGRPIELPELQKTVGLFINTIPLRVSLPAPTRSLRDWLTSLLDQNVAMREHDYLPLVKVQALSEIPRTQPLFHSLLVFENVPVDASVAPYARALQVSAGKSRVHTNYPVTAMVIPSQRLVLDLSYDERVFEAATVARLLADFERYTQALVEHVDEPFAALPRASNAERAALLDRGLGTRREYPFGTGYVGLFEQMVQRNPERVVAGCAGEAMTYRQLAGKANALAWTLRRRGVPFEGRVAVLAERDLDWLVLTLGVLAAGASYVPLDSRQPVQRLADIIRLSGASLVVCSTRSSPASRDGLERELGHAPAVLGWDIAGEPLNARGPALRPSPRALAYVIFTSGSTGVPKGVMVEHAGMLNNMLSKVPDLELTADDVIAQTASPAFDISVWQLLMAPLCGARLEIVPDGVAQDPRALLECVAARRISVLESVPSLIQGMLDDEPIAIPTLRVLIATGEALAPELARRWMERYPGVRLFNAYGPAECSDDVSMHRLVEPPAAGCNNLPIGRATDNNRLLVLDRALELVPLGVVGEICVAGVGVGRGYLGDAAMTARCFVPNPHAMEAGERLYRTGDLGRYGADGLIEFMGRVDHQLKLRGYRVELGEIEARLLEQSGVREAVVVARASPRGKQLVAYVTALAAAADLSNLREQLGRVLPEYMLPSQIVVLGELPLSANGKVNRKALPAPGWSGRDEHVEPGDELERQLVDIWREVLGVERVGITDNFFELGGDSIVALQVVSRARRAGLVLEPRHMFQHQTVQLLARAVQSSPAAPAAAATATPLAVLTPGELQQLGASAEAVEDVYPLSTLQEGMLFHAEYSPELGLYVNQHRVPVRGLDPERFKAAWRYAIERHAILRTGFVTRQGERGWLQVVQRSVPLPVEERDLQGHPDLAAALASLARQERERGFDLQRPPLLRLLLVRTAPDCHHLIWTDHHVLMDGWSTARLIGEVMGYYVSQRALQASPPRYRDYIEWLGQRDAEQSERFWTGEVRELKEGTLLGAEAVEGAASGSVERTLGREETARLKRFAAEERVTLNTLLQGAWVLLLQRQTGRRRVCFGATVSGRPPSVVGSEEMLGLFINTLPVVEKPRGDQKAGEWLRELQEHNLRLREHETASLGQVQKWWGRAGERLFDTLLVFENYPLGEALKQRSGGAIEFGEVEAQEKTHYALTLVVTQGDELRLSYRYVGLGEGRTRALSEQLAQLLGELTKDPGRKLGELTAWRWDACVFQGPKNPRRPEWLHERIERRAEQTPQVIAVRSGEQRLSYGELEERANRVARLLVGKGVGAEQRVGLCLSRGAEQIVGLLAIVKAGGGYVPLDPGLPEERLRYQLQSSGARLVVTEEKLQGLFEDAGVERWCIDRDWSEASREEPARLGVNIHAQQVVYCLYTSGSTGKPKGVEVTHGGLSHYLGWALDEYEVKAGEKSAVHSSIGFDLTVTSLWLPLCAGGTVELAEEGEGLEALSALLQETGGVELLKLTPSHAQGLAEVLEEPLWQVKTAVVGGEALSWETVSALKRLMPRARLFNEYGPTETVVGCAIHEARGSGSGAVSIGRAIDETELYVMDLEFQPAPVGVAGELCIGGGGLARGYRGQPGQTAERFVPHPYADGERLYRTGDVARYGADGRLAYLGRLDQQVKLRGYRVELGEIEARLVASGGVKEAAVVLRQSGGGQQLIGYVVAREGAELGEEALKGELGRELPEYMVPARVRVVEALPLTRNGKLDRKALSERGGEERTHEPPRGELEETLARIWSAVLGVGRVGRTDDFFELGGDSIVSLRVVSRAREAGLALRPRDVFEQRTVQGLARVVEQAAGGGSGEDSRVAPGDVEQKRRERLERQGLSADVVDDVYDLSPLQRGILFHCQLEPELGVYINQLRVVVERLDVERLSAAWQRALERHDVLRTRFSPSTSGEGWLQVVQREALLELEEEDGRAEAEPLAWATERARRERERGFDLERAPLMRLKRLRLEDDRDELVWTYHHIILDGWSSARLLEEVLESYSGLGSEAPARGVYGRYIEWLGAQDAAENERFWKQQLQALGEPTRLTGVLADSALDPPESGQRPRPEAESGTLCRHWSEERTRRLRRFAQRERVTLHTLVQGAWALLLARYTGQSAVAFGTAVSGRPASLAGAETALGLFINTLTVVAKPSGEQRVGEWLRALLRQNLELREHEFTELSEVQRWAGRAGQPLFDTLLVFDNYPVEQALGAGRAGDARFELVEARGATHYALSLEASAAEQLRLTYGYDPQLLGAGRVRQLAEHFERVLEQLVESAEARLGKIGLLGEAEAQRLARWNDTAVDHGAARTLHELVEERAAAEPEAVAVVFGEQQLTYRELSERAHQLGHELRAQGVGPDVLVGVCLERSLELVVALLGVLVAGGAYVPLDPSYPRERLGYMLEDSGAPLLLTTEKLARRLPASGGTRLFCMDRDWPQAARQPRSAPGPLVHPDHLAYCIYTSGSTGTPKAVQISHAAIVNHMRWMQRRFDFTAQDRVLQKTPFSFDASVWEFWLPLSIGARLVMAAPEASRDPLVLLAELRRHEITVLQVVPQVLEALLMANCQGAALGFLRYLFCGGEALAPELARSARTALGKPVHNLYGPTEASIDATHWECIDLDGRVPIGTPIDNTLVRILGPDLSFTPPGLIGELCVGGVGLARGYLARPALTAERFVPDPLASRGERLYRTGDYARHRSDGAVEWLGRIDHQVKVRGHRIELGEVEARLREHPAVRQAVVMAHEQQLVGYIVAEGGDSSLVTALEERLLQCLPEYMVPGTLMLLEQMPLTPSGKIDRAALPAPWRAAQTYVEPSSELGRQLAGIWQKALAVPRVGANDNFFDLGGHSALAMTVIARIKSELGIAVPLRCLFAARSLAEFEAMARAEASSTKAAE